MAIYSMDKKSEILQRLAPPESLSIAEVARQEQIPKTTIQGWLDKEKKKSWKMMNTGVNSPSSEEKFHIVMETFALNEAELGAYARKKGLMLSDIQSWKENCCSANESKKTAKAKSSEEAKKDEKALKEELKSCKMELKSKEKELKSKKKQLIRKDETIAEVTALLVLKGKAQAIWGDNEDE